MIDVTPQVEARMNNGDKPIQLIQLDLSDDLTLYLTTTDYDIEWGGVDWIGGGLLVDIGTLDRVDEIRTSENQLVLTGVDLTFPSIILNNQQTNRKITVRDAFLNPVSGGVVPDPYIRDILYIDKPEIIQDSKGDSLVVLTLSGEFADFDFKAGIRTTEASHQRFYEGDRLFQYATTVSKEQRWGGE